MKKSAVVVMAILTLWGLPAAAFAQGFLGGNCTASNAADCGLPGTLSLYAGWLEHRDASVWALQGQGDIGTARWPLRGLWFGASSDVALGENLGLLISGSVFVPQRSSGTWYLTPASVTFDFDISSYEWWSADGYAKYGTYGGVEALAGFRWDHTSVRVDYSDNRSDDYILNAYIPLFGVQINQRASGGSLLFRALGTPWVGGRLRYHFWGQPGTGEYGDFDVSSGYFAEIFADYSLKIQRNLSLGAFVKWNELHVKTSERSLSGSTTEPVLWTVNVKSCTVGASLAFAFASPL